ncbi:hypothetical protein AC579_9103 [Pseudocercospora musae]|uniref:Uncharacterized protein n=1 Tax=Pseudocercospora musae TaxID=113226 RepID=A0A139IJ06_9PEZI|nr:hypothetical protein AC579_9103 [Pseudocercospora musae]
MPIPCRQSDKVLQRPKTRAPTSAVAGTEDGTEHAIRRQLRPKQDPERPLIILSRPKYGERYEGLHIEDEAANKVRIAYSCYAIVLLDMG